jgi:cell division protein FtsB
MEIQQNEKDKKSKTYLMILIGALLALNIGIGINLWLGNKEKQELTTKVETLTNDKVTLNKEVDDLKTELDALRTENEGLNAQMTEKDLAIEQKIKQIKLLLSKGKLSESEYRKAKEEIASLRGQIEDYKLRIAELTKSVEGLTADKTVLTQNLSEEQARSLEKDKALESKDRTIAMAKRLHSSNISATGVRERKMFGKKEVETEKAAKVQEIKIRFMLDQNLVADPGDKDIFVKIIGPDGAPLASKTETTMVDGTPTLYTEKKTVDYQNEKVEQVVYCKKQGNFTKGEYTVEIFAEGYKVGSSKFVLR